MQELLFLHSVRRLILIDICMKFRQDSLRGLQVTERTRFVTDRQTDGQTDRQTDARRKTICLPTLKWGRHNAPKTESGLVQMIRMGNPFVTSGLTYNICDWLSNLHINIGSPLVFGS